MSLETSISILSRGHSLIHQHSHFLTYRCCLIHSLYHCCSRPQMQVPICYLIKVSHIVLLHLHPLICLHALLGFHPLLGFHLLLHLLVPGFHCHPHQTQIHHYDLQSNPLVLCHCRSHAHCPAYFHYSVWHQIISH